MADFAPIQIRGWQDFLGHEGIGLSLFYLTPDGMSGLDDRAYRMLVGLPGIVESNMATAGSTSARMSHSRVSSRVWQANVVLAKDAVLGEILPKTLDPAGNGKLWNLQEVQQWQSESGFLRNAVIWSQDQTEKLDKILEFSPFGGGDFIAAGQDAAPAVRDAAGNVADAATKTATDLLSKVLIPAGIVIGLAFVVMNPGVLRRA